MVIEAAVADGFMQKTAKSFLNLYYMCTFAPDDESFFDKRSAKAITCVPLVASAQIFLNHRNCFYLQKVCDFIQSYEISERNEKKNNTFSFISERERARALAQGRDEVSTKRVSRAPSLYDFR